MNSRGLYQDLSPNLEKVLDYLRSAPSSKDYREARTQGLPSRYRGMGLFCAFAQTSELVTLPHKKAPHYVRGLVGSIGFEPTTPSMSRKYSNQLS